MDWDEEYELLKAGRLPPPGNASSSRPRRPIDNDDDVQMAGPNVQPEDDDEGKFLGRPDAFPEDEPKDTPLDRLIRHWMNERHCPDILPAQEDLLAHLLDHLRRQSEAVQLLRSDPSTSEDEHMRIMLVQTEIERVKFIVRSYVRTRLFKIERYANFVRTNGEIQTRLTAAERDHALRHAKITDQHFVSSVLQGLPETQSHLDDTPLFVPPMITEPDKSRPVFVHALQRCPRITLPDGAKLEMDKGHISLMPYNIVEQLVARGEVEL
ncbi:hypothetical protein CPB83DRAFT_850071, partial [Crepidotus variabilis]